MRLNKPLTLLQTYLYEKVSSLFQKKLAVHLLASAWLEILKNLLAATFLLT